MGVGRCDCGGLYLNLNRCSLACAHPCGPGRRIARAKATGESFQDEFALDLSWIAPFHYWLVLFRVASKFAAAAVRARGRIFARWQIMKLAQGAKDLGHFR
eukprot:12714914-Alexandrium_andersonii.AAC.1